MKKVIDISSYQGNVDFSKVKNQVDAVIIRIGWGDNVERQDDRKTLEYIKGCQDNGIPYAFYLYSYAVRLNGGESIESEIAHTERIINGYKPFAIFIDMEDKSTTHLGKDTLTNFADTYCKHFKSKGYNVGVYANKNWFTNYLNYAYLKSQGHLIWLAHYGISQPSLECDIWQYGDNGHLDGINTNTTDLNYLYNGSILNGSTPMPTPTPTPTPSENQVDVYYRVKTQKHGWLSEVRNLEDYAGYQNSPITGLAIKVSKGSIKYRVHVKGGQWLPYVTGYDTNNSMNGWAGNNMPIDLVEVYYNTPYNIRPYKKAKYKVNDYSYQYDNEKKNGQDGYAGAKNVNAVKFQIVIE